jgi:hypothetical protein
MACTNLRKDNKCKSGLMPPRRYFWATNPGMKKMQRFGMDVVLWIAFSAA